MIIVPIPTDSLFSHGEPASNGPRIDIWAIGFVDGQVVWIEEDGDGWLGRPYKDHMRHLGALLSSDQIPPMAEC